MKKFVKECPRYHVQCQCGWEAGPFAYRAALAWRAHHLRSTTPWDPTPHRVHVTKAHTRRSKAEPSNAN